MPRRRQKQRRLPEGKHRNGTPRYGMPRPFGSRSHVLEPSLRTPRTTQITAAACAWDARSALLMNS